MVIYLDSCIFRDGISTADDGVGSRAQLWPTDLDSNALQNYNCSTTEAKIYDPRCPSAGYDFLYQHFKTWWQYGDRRDMLEFNIQDYSMVKRIYARVSDDTRVDTYAWTTHWPTAMLQDAKRDLYDSSLIWLRDNHRHDPPYPGYLDLATEKTFAVKTEVPYVRTACVSGYTIDIVKETLNSSIVMQFPAHNGNWGFPRDWEGFTPGPIPYLSQQFDTAAVIQQHFQSRGFLDYQEDGGITLNATIPAVVTVPVTLAANNSTEMGMAILVRNVDSSTFNAYSCIVDPFWAPGQSIIVSNKNSNGGYHEWRKDRVRNVVTTELGSLDEAQFIRVQPGWYDLLSPMLPDSTEYGSLRPGRVPSSSNRSLMERLLENVLYPLFEDPLGGLPSARSVEYAISAYFADGLSRCGSTIQTNASGIAGWPAFRPDDNRMARSLVFKGSPKLKGESAKPAALAGYEATEMLMTAVFTGYLLATIGSFDYFAVAVLLFHAAMALGYTVLVFLWYPDIMEALDSIPEMVAMAQNSRPPDNDGLKNTSAGIRHFKTLGRLAIVETSRALDESDGKEELVLRFQETERDARRIPQIGREYGGIKSI
ncbi:hypothetical protein SAMD00023353_0800400 [Rosellinia necatrix]|uniref:Uncharacterized protein n=1 Tax=Rosellinia necatrix TaxID=77044 RepID=A0A1S8A697_ROSNE|nr:hypothetical protein SAMD00023353_0800400 [Rosellinia necatrix]